jgi:hypothetical protein
MIISATYFDKLSVGDPGSETIGQKRLLYNFMNFWKSIEFGDCCVFETE